MIIVPFRSRTQTVGFGKVLKRYAVASEIISAPKEIAVGCGLAISVQNQDEEKLRKIIGMTEPQGIMGIYYAVERNGGVDILR